MEKEEFRDILEKLHNELKAIQSVDERGRELLMLLMKDIKQILEPSNGYQTCEHRTRDENTLKDRLSNAINYFEESHPTLSLAMKKVIDTLSNMGI